ncbi:hypothetical protein BAUCODRAFT_121060 [Baudoinia panamericana UAMH 10762]|uniref:Uncharacterized protein n=1 Tax=Baudoinia panamericana (strain UAMH 10762) TaxID=717646 RepID=M2NFW8_BAUPA|nr:uncharacterized protein BAUCODRAFT_121060 [Baudoinia panamericana UAMH 10762]EMC98169.1 hypothetical protein BAUCODRAFT_121060 [Baudoinia panamericana UAMH 10762]
MNRRLSGSELLRNDSAVVNMLAMCFNNDRYCGNDNLAAGPGNGLYAVASSDDVACERVLGFAIDTGASD